MHLYQTNSTMTNTNIDYVNTYFEYQTLTRIHGQPGHPSLKIIKDEIKANISSVTSDLGGGASGNLWLILTQPEYAFVSATNYVRPVHQGPLVIPPAASQHESTRLRENYKEAIRLYQEMIAVKKCHKIIRSSFARILLTWFQKYSYKYNHNGNSHSSRTSLHDLPINWTGRTTRKSW